jgi:hypothetical protein
MINTVEKQYLDGEFTTYKITYVGSDRVIIAPHNEANRHYQEILEWVENGGVIVDNGA